MNIVGLYSEETLKGIYKINRENGKLKKENERLHSIIKEVRKKIIEDNFYIEEAKIMYIEDADDEMLKIPELQLINNNLSRNDNYLKILDKENK